MSQLKIDAPSGSLVDDNRTSVAIALGVGANTQLTRHITLGLKGRYTYLASATYNPTLAGRTAGVSNISGDEHISQLLTKSGFQF